MYICNALWPQDEASKPQWVSDLISSGIPREVHKFSKFIHGCAVLLSEEVQAMPYWIDDPSLRDSIVASGSEEVRRSRLLDCAFTHRNHDDSIIDRLVAIVVRIYFIQVIDESIPGQFGDIYNSKKKHADEKRKPAPVPRRDSRTPLPSGMHGKSHQFGGQGGSSWGQHLLQSEEEYYEDEETPGCWGRYLMMSILLCAPRRNKINDVCFSFV